MTTPANKHDVTRLEWIDELRGVAALVVVISHYRALFDPDFKLAILDFLGHGVQLFYLLSGFILYKLYLNKINSGTKYASFMLRRYFRVAPMFYIATIAQFILHPNIYSPSQNMVSHFLILPMGFNSNFINGIIGVEWSIFVEFSFYLVFPIIAWLFQRHKYALLLLSIILTSLPVVLPRLLNMPKTVWLDVSSYIYFLPSTQLGFFLVGMLLVDISNSSYLAHIKSSVRNAIFIISVIGIILTPLATHIMPMRLYMIGAFLFLAVPIYNSISKPEFISRFLLWSGQRSYSIYLLHVPLLALATPWAKGNEIIVAVLLCAALLGLSSITYRYIELKGIELGRKIESKLFSMKTKKLASGGTK